MPVFEIEVGGKVMEVEAPDMATAAKAVTNMAVPPVGEAQTVSGQPANGAAIPAPAPGATPLPDVPEQYRGGKVGQQNISNSLQKQLEEVPWYEKAVAGIGAAPMQAMQSLKQLTGNAPTDREVRDWRDITDTGAGAAGNIAGNVAMTALPIGAAEKALRGGISILPKALQYARYGVVPTVGAAESALLRPTVEGESRAEEAGKAALFAGGAATGMRALGRTVSGLAKTSKLGKELMDQGIQPSVGEASEGFIGKTIGLGEDILATVGIKPGRDRTSRQAMAKIKEEVTPLFKAFGQTVDEDISRATGFFAHMDKNFSDAYGAILDNKVVKMPVVFRTSAVNKSAKAMTGATDETVKSFEKQMASIFSSVKGNNTGTGWKQAMNQIAEAKREALKNAGTEFQSAQLVKGFAAAEKELMDRAIKTKGLTQAELAALKDLNNGWAKYKVVQDAALLPRGGTGPLSGLPGERAVSIDDIVTVSERSAPDAQRLNEAEFFAKTTRPMSELLSRRSAKGTGVRQAAYGLGGAVGLGSFAVSPPVAATTAAILGLGALGGTEKGAKVMLGNTAAQRKIAKVLQDSVYPRLGTLASATNTDENEE